MQVRICLLGHVIVDGDVDTLDINTTTEDVGGHADAGLELLEFLVSLDTAKTLDKILRTEKPERIHTALPDQYRSARRC
jgi:hypothetical protein